MFWGYCENWKEFGNLSLHGPWPYSNNWNTMYLT